MEPVQVLDEFGQLTQESRLRLGPDDLPDDFPATGAGAVLLERECHHGLPDWDVLLEWSLQRVVPKREVLQSGHLRGRH